MALEPRTLEPVRAHRRSLMERNHPGTADWPAVPFENGRGRLAMITSRLRQAAPIVATSVGRTWSSDYGQGSGLRTVEHARDTRCGRVIDGPLPSPIELLPNHLVMPVDSTKAILQKASQQHTERRLMLRVQREEALEDCCKPLDAFLLYRAADEGDIVYYDALALVDEFQLSPDVIEHVVVGRARSPDARERLEGPRYPS